MMNLLSMTISKKLISSRSLHLALYLLFLFCIGSGSIMACSESSSSGNGGDDPELDLDNMMTEEEDGGDVDVEMELDSDVLEVDDWEPDRDNSEVELEEESGNEDDNEKSELEPDLESEWEIDEEQEDDSNVIQPEAICVPDLANDYPNTWQYLYPYPYDMSSGESRKPVLSGYDDQAWVSATYGTFVTYENDNWRLLPNTIDPMKIATGNVYFGWFPVDQAVMPNGGVDSLLTRAGLAVHENGCWFIDERLAHQYDLNSHVWIGDEFWATDPGDRIIIKASADNIAEYIVEPDNENDVLVFPTAIASWNEEPFAFGVAQDGEFQGNVYLIRNEGGTWIPLKIGETTGNRQGFPIDIHIRDGKVTVVDQLGDVFQSQPNSLDGEWSRWFALDGCGTNSFITWSVLDDNGKLHLSANDCSNKYMVFSDSALQFALSNTAFEDIGFIMGIGFLSDGRTVLPAKGGILTVSTDSGEWNTWPVETLPLPFPDLQPIHIGEFHINRVTRRTDGSLVAAFSQSTLAPYHGRFFTMDYRNGCWQFGHEPPLEDFIVDDFFLLGGKLYRK